MITASHSYTAREIDSQPSIWRSVLAGMGQQLDALRTTMPGDAIRQITVIGCGSTYYFSASVARLLSLLTGQVASAFPASELWLMPRPTVAETLLVAVSRSGTTTETIRAVERFRQAGGSPVIVVTCYPDSPLARLADVVLAAPEAQEQSVVQTRSFTSMYLLALGLVFNMSARDDLQAQLEHLPEALEGVFAGFGSLPGQWGEDLRYQKVFFLANGSLYGLACEAMLKLKEMSLTWTEAYQTLEFRHGPMSLVDDSALVVGFLSEAALQAELDTFHDLQRLGAAVVLCSGDSLKLHGWQPDFHITAPAAIDPWIRGLLFLPLLQRLGYHRALAKGLDPDSPRHLKAVINL